MTVDKSFLRKAFVSHAVRTALKTTSFVLSFCADILEEMANGWEAAMVASGIPMSVAEVKEHVDQSEDRLS